VPSNLGTSSFIQGWGGFGGGGGGGNGVVVRMASWLRMVSTFSDSSSSCSEFVGAIEGE